MFLLIPRSQYALSGRQYHIDKISIDKNKEKNREKYISVFLSIDIYFIRLNPINPRSKKLSGETNVDCICAYTAQDSLQQEIIRDNNCARQAQRNPTTHNKNPCKNRSVASALSVIDFERGERAKGE